MKLVFWLFVFIIALVLASFAASNRESVALALWPLPFVAEFPLYLAILCALLLGFIIGAFCVWLGGGRRRREARQRRRRVTALERELAATQAELPAAAIPPPPAIAARG